MNYIKNKKFGSLSDFDINENNFKDFFCSDIDKLQIETQIKICIMLIEFMIDFFEYEMSNNDCCHEDLKKFTEEWVENRFK
jgi:hypothetical protein